MDVWSPVQPDPGQGMLSCALHVGTMGTTWKFILFHFLSPSATGVAPSELPHLRAKVRAQDFSDPSRDSIVLFSSQETSVPVVLRGGEKGMNREFGISRCKLLYIEWIKSKFLQYSIGNCIQYTVINYSGKQ